MLDEMKSVPHWACSYRDQKTGELNKRPMQSRNKPASSTDRSTWSSFKDVCAQGADRVGFMLSDSDPYVVIDLDAPKGADDSKIADFEKYAQGVIAKFDSYTEKSNSGKGYHIFIRANKGGNRRCKDTKRGVEIYDNERYLIVTGNKLDGVYDEPQPRQGVLDAYMAETFPEPAAPKSITLPAGESDVEDEEIIDIIKNDCFKATFDCFNGISGNDNTGSELDAEFYMRFAFFTRDAEQIARLWDESAIAREKWQKRRPEQIRQIERAIEMQGEHFKWGDKREDRASTLQEANDIVKASKAVEEMQQAAHIKEASEASEGMLEVIKQQGKYPSGVVGQMARVFEANARYSDTQYNLASAIMTVAAIAGRAYTFEGLALNLFMIVTGESGSGKDSITKNMDRMLQMIDEHNGERFLSTLARAFPASPQGMHQDLLQAGYGTVTYKKSEFDKLMIQGAKGNIQATAILDSMLEIYSQSNKDYVLRAPTRASKDNRVMDVAAPCVNLLCEGVQTTLFNGLSHEDITGGMLSRMQMVMREGKGRKHNEAVMAVQELSSAESYYFSTGENLKAEQCKAERLKDYPEYDKNGRVPMPDSVMSSMALLSAKVKDACHYMTNLAVNETVRDVMSSDFDGDYPKTTRPDTIEVIIHPDATRYINEQTLEVDRRFNEDDESTGAAWTRVTLKAKKIAAILAVADNPVKPIISKSHMRWSYEWSVSQSKKIAAAIRSGEIGNGKIIEAARSAHRSLISMINGTKKLHPNIAKPASVANNAFVKHQCVSSGVINRLLTNMREQNPIIRKDIATQAHDHLISTGALIEIDKSEIEGAKSNYFKIVIDAKV